jgi:YVTN family beta-propeller protein
MNSSRAVLSGVVGVLAIVGLTAAITAAQTPSPALLVLEKGDNQMAIVDPATLKIVGRVPSGPDPHEIEASPDGKLAYISNYGGSDSTLNTITVVNLSTRKQLAPINLGALHSAHGLAYRGGKLYFTVETNKAMGRYDPATHSIDLVLGTGQDRTHMVEVSQELDRIFTSNVSSGTISIIEQIEPSRPGPPPGAPAGAGPPPGAPHKTWHVTNIPSGPGAEGFDVSPDGKQLWAANAGDGTVTIIDVASKKATETFPVSVHPNRLKFTPDGQRVLLSGGLGPASGGPNVAVLDAATHKEIKQLNMGGGSAGILVAPNGSRAYIAVSAKDKIAVLDLQTLEVTGELPTGRGPDGLAWAQAK